MQSLKHWSGVLQKHCESILETLSPDAREAALHRVSALKSSVSDIISTSTSQFSLSEAEEREETVVFNFGIPVAVIACKSDLMEAWSRPPFEYREEHLDFIQLHLRQWCLEHAAVLIYASAKENKNIVLLREYLLMRLFSYPFAHQPNYIERSAVFIPAGWESQSKVNTLLDTAGKFGGLEGIFENVIVGGSMRDESLDEANDSMPLPDEQVFLTGELQALHGLEGNDAGDKLMQHTLRDGAGSLQSVTSVSSNSLAPATTGADSVSHPPPKSSSISQGGGGGGGGGEGAVTVASSTTAASSNINAAGNASGDGEAGKDPSNLDQKQIANFFNLLLNRETKGKKREGGKE